MSRALFQSIAPIRYRLAPMLALLYLAVLLTTGWGHQGLFDRLGRAKTAAAPGQVTPTQLVLVAAQAELHGCPACQWETVAVSARPELPQRLDFIFGLDAPIIPLPQHAATRVASTASARAPPVVS